MTDDNATYEELAAEVKRLQTAGRLSSHPTREDIIDWAYGNTKIENPDVTMEMATRVIDAKLGNSP